MIIARFLNEAESMILVDFGSGKKVSVPVDGGNEDYQRLLSEGIVPDPYVDPRTPQQIYDEKNLAPTDALLLSPRLIEELFDWAVNGVTLPDASKAKFAPIVADRKAKRAARP
jgi:hypothetical protein